LNIYFKNLYKKTFRLLRDVYRFTQIYGIRIIPRVLFGDYLIKLKIPGQRYVVYSRKRSSDTPTFRQIFINREYDYNIPDFKPKTIVDIGAYNGFSTVFFACKYPDAKILAIEPEPSNYDLLIKNTAQFSNVTTIRGAIWHRRTNLKISNPGADKWAIQTDEASDKDKDTIKAITMENILSQIHSPTIDILKVDIEGAERTLFRANTDWLKRINVLIIEIHPVAGCRDAVFDAVNKFPRSVQIRGDTTMIKFNHD